MIKNLYLIENMPIDKIAAIAEVSQKEVKEILKEKC